MTQQKQSEWTWQWDTVFDDNDWLLADWIYPNVLEDFRGKDVLDCGCGAGQHAAAVAPYARSVVGVDLNASERAKRTTLKFSNVSIREDDLATMDLGRQFDVVYCIGVIHHTADPDRTFANLVKHCKPGGRLIVWAYSWEGNFLNRTLVEGAKRAFVRRLPRRAVFGLAKGLTALMYPPIYTLYRLPVRQLPYYEYFENWRRLGFERNTLNVLDKLNAPTTWFIRREQVQRWFGPERFDDVHISPYKGVSWRGSGTLRS